MTRWLKALWLVLALAPFGCAEPPTFDQVSANLPPVPAGEARIFIYRPPDAYQGLSWVRVFLNGRDVGAVGPGHVIMRDVPAGTYDIAPGGSGLWPDQDKIVTVTPGQTVYAKLTSFLSPNTGTVGFNQLVLSPTYVVVLQDTATGAVEISRLWYSAASRPAARAG